MIEEIKKENTYGYVRVSSKSQETNSSIQSQKEILQNLGIPQENIFEEIESAAGKIQDRPVLTKLSEEILKPGDTLYVTKMDRCSRNTLEFLFLTESFEKRSINFVALDLPYAEDSGTRKFISTTLSAMAQFENERRRSRQLEGIAAAKKNGKYKGRKSVIDKKLTSQVEDLKENKKLSITQISKITGKSRNTIYKILKQELHYKPGKRWIKSKRDSNENLS